MTKDEYISKLLETVEAKRVADSDAYRITQYSTMSISRELLSSVESPCMLLSIEILRMTDRAVREIKRKCQELSEIEKEYLESINPDRRL